jgi:hypothetical protein
VTWWKLNVQEQYLAQRMNIILTTRTLKTGEWFSVYWAWAKYSISLCDVQSPCRDRLYSYYTDIQYIQCIYTYNPQSQPTIFSLFSLIFSLHVSVPTDHLQVNHINILVFMRRIAILHRHIHFTFMLFFTIIHLNFLLYNFCFYTSELYIS